MTSKGTRFEIARRSHCAHIREILQQRRLRARSHRYQEGYSNLDQIGIELEHVIFGMKVPNWKIMAICQAIKSAGISPIFSRVSYNSSTLELEKEEFDFYG